MALILYTCSYQEEVEQYLTMFRQEGINFEYVNENPEAKNTQYGCFDKKPYMNIILDDKAGFEGDLDEDGVNDWLRIKQVLAKIDQQIYEAANHS